MTYQHWFKQVLGDSLLYEVLVVVLKLSRIVSFFILVPHKWNWGSGSKSVY
jgi:hypothetical protein